MPLTPGSRLGPYEVLAPIGAGGMGEVYRARDTRLERTVAIKVLPTHLSSSPDLRQRFDREAKLISQVTHPHICALYDVGHQDGTDYIVMEYLEGQTLSERLAKGPLPLDQALRYGIEIADGLEKAHRQGIVHRDLKPANVMLTASGVKILDFGLAKALGPASSASILTALPTETPLTEKGALLGTIQYMAPELLEGKDADVRTDIFALGLVLHEMATGQKAFRGATQASLIGAILRDEPPPISRLQPIAPRSLDRVVATCLVKEPENRWQTARDVALQLEGIRQDRSAPEQPTPGAVGAGRHRGSAVVPWAIAAASVALALFGLTSGLRRGSSRPQVVRSYLLPPPDTTFHVFGANVAAPALSPDGRRLAFGTLESDGSYRLWVRGLDDLEAYPVPGGDGALFPFWSPDSRSIGFFANGRLKVVDASPSPPPPRELADVIEARGGSWGPDGTIIYAPGNFTAIMRVPAAGGTPLPATSLDGASGELAHRWPRFLPDGRRFLYESRKPSPGPTTLPVGTYLGSLDGKEKQLIISEVTSVSYSEPGYLLFRRANTLMAVACDPKSLAVRGDPIVLTDSLEGFAATGLSLYNVRDDLLIYSPRMGLNPSRMVWLDRTGTELSTVGPPSRFTHMSLSADGRWAVTAQIEEPQPPDLWVFDTVVGRGIRLTRDSIAQVIPVFSPDGHVLFSAFSTGPWDLWEMDPRGGGRDLKTLLATRSTKSANDVSPDGEWLIYREFNSGTRGDLKALSLTGDRQPRIFIATSNDESNADFSPDGRWVAYSSDESGRTEIYAASFPDPTRRFRVSSDGGSQPRWSRDGKQLFYVRSGQMISSLVGRRGDDLTFGESRPLFSLPLFTLVDPGFDVVTRYDVAPDGRFLALLRAGNEPPTPLVLVQNWREGLETANK